ncbi:MAG: DNA/RNA non-specific endonuclease, partial [Cyclobacteriaceae bacterium]|nr:DNA/RNA non-specific endonuclease [Cyclobacteriaceae bacterium]
LAVTTTHGQVHFSTTDSLLPVCQQGETFIRHLGYALHYNEVHEQADWIAYELTADELRSVVERSDHFLPDPDVVTGSATVSDYHHSGYDRGHLAPAADMGWSLQSMSESFYFSNICPQDPSFNRGIWKRLEEQVRTWAIENEAVWVVTGPVLTDSLPAIGTNQVSVPRYFYKVILDYTGPVRKGIGFILPNQKPTEGIEYYAVPIDSVEQFTGIDFFCQLPDDEEHLLESAVVPGDWSWDLIPTGDKTTEEESAIQQCSGVTKKGARCRNMTTDPRGYCHLHQRE